MTDDEGAPSQQIRELADALSAQAQRTLAALVEDGPDLAIRLGDARAWLRGSTPAWMARRAGRTFGIDQLGDGHRRLAELAISRTTASLRRSSYGLSVTILDEPERALHLSALERLLAGLTELDPCVLVASHSPKLLDAGDNLVHVRQTLDAEVRLSAPVMWADDQLGLDHVAEDLGISRSDLLALTRVFVLVEGPHDQVVLTQLCRDALTETRGRVLHLGGTRDVHHAATSDVLFEATTAKFIFVVDNASASWAKRQYEKAHDGEDLWRNNSRLPNERRALLRLLEAGQREGRLDRIRLQPLAKRDIANYLPASEVVPGFGTWREVDEAFKRHKGGGFEPGDGRKKKAWANAQARQQGLTGRYHTSGLARIAKAIADGELDAEIHKDIQDLREAIRSAGGS